MGCNIEIKARARDFKYQQEKVEKITSSLAQYISQCDTFFAVATGRLKLREFADGTADTKRKSGTKAAIGIYFLMVAVLKRPNRIAAHTQMMKD